MRSRELVFLLILLGIFTSPVFTYADRASELKSQIDSKQGEISKLDALIAEQEKQLNSVSQQANTLQNALKIVNLSIQKLDNQITKTETEIRATNLKIDELNLNIKSTTSDIAEHEEALRRLIRDLAASDEESLTNLLMSYQHFSDLLALQSQNLSLQNNIRSSAQELRQLKTDLGHKVNESEAAKAKLVKLKRELDDQKKIAANERSRQSALLSQTRNQEQNYKKLLTDNRARREAFSRELEAYESQLRLEIDQSKLPSVQRGILAWPMDERYITQHFGKTADAKRLYSSGTHNGIDFRASVGTPVKSAGSGLVAGTGDTDLVCRGASYGKWVLVKHDNGLATLSAHLSLIKVATGQRVNTGDLLGYSGQTGYATGPHLHFTVAAAQGTQIASIKSKVCPGTYTIPVFDTRAYLDPILYL